MTAAQKITSASALDEAPIKLADDRFFEPWRAPRTDKAKALVADVIRQVESYEGLRKRRDRARTRSAQTVTTIAAVVCDLAHAHLKGHTGGLAVSRSFRELGVK